MFPATFYLFPTSKPPWARAGVSGLITLQRVLEPEALASEQFIYPSTCPQAPSTMAWTQSRHRLHSSQSWHSDSVSTPSRPSKAASGPGNHTSARGRELGAGRRRQSWGKRNQIVPKLLEPPHQEEGKVGSAGGGGGGRVAR